MDVNKFLAGLRVLAIDGDRTTLFVLKRLLQRCNYNNETTVTEADIALDMLRERKNRDDQFDLVISDVVIPGIDGFKLLERISLEMDIPVIVLSTNDEMETMIKGIKHGSCEYLAKPARMEHVRNIWTHVVGKSRNDPRNNISDEKKGSNNTKKCSKRNKNDGDCAEEDKVETSTQKRQRIKWSTQLHDKFVEAIYDIGMDRAVPKNILEVMNVDGLSRYNTFQVIYKFCFHSYTLLLLPVQDVSRLIFSGSSCATVSSGGLPSANKCFPSGASSSSSSNISNGVVFNISRPFSPGTSGSSSASISNDCSPLATSMRFPSSGSCSSYASMLPGKMLEANRGIPFDVDSFLEEIAASEMPAPSRHLPLQSPELVNQHSVHIPSSSTGLFNQVVHSSHLPLQSPESVNRPSIQIQSSADGLFSQVSRESHLFAILRNNPSNSENIGVPSRFPNIGHSAGTSIGSSQGNRARINRIARFVASSGHAPTFGNEYQNQMTGLMGRITPVVGFSEQVVLEN
ncbi:Two-component response regulator ORR24 [Dichanthelium oligosanthes]|uniref:Two-component response regulator ORR24 n=1 Tax=Dichanthelium oligosanthes TaxID=888268 RepID=A0A1E5WLG7_9POAL|nr:Two-component response regulator ORR24 [Dichanthelium oligosanthes]